MITDNKNKRLIVYFNSSINNVFKILPLYEERNIGLEKYIESLLLELEGLQKIIEIHHSDEYLSLLSILESIKKEVNKSNQKSIIKREVFKSISIIKSIIKKLENEVGD